MYFSKKKKFMFKKNTEKTYVNELHILIINEVYSCATEILKCQTEK